MGVLSNLLEERYQATAVISPIVEEVTREYSGAIEIYPVLEATLQIVYEDYAKKTNSEEQLRAILQEIADYVITAIALFEAETKQQKEKHHHEKEHHKDEHREIRHHEKHHHEKEHHHEIKHHRDVQHEIKHHRDVHHHHTISTHEQPGLLSRIHQDVGHFEKEHPYATGAALGAVGTAAGAAATYGLYKLGKKIYEKLKNRK